MYKTIFCLAIILSVLVIFSACSITTSIESNDEGTEVGAIPTPESPSPKTETTEESELPEPYQEEPQAHQEIIDISQIPYFGNRDNFNLSASHALAFADATRSAATDIDDGVNFCFDVIYPVFIDVSGDGAPLLLLVGRMTETDTWGSLPMHPYFLYSYANGEFQVAAPHMAVGIMQVEEENLLTIGWVHDFGGYYNLYQVRGGTTHFVSTMTFIADWHGGDPHGEISINGKELTPEEYWAALETIPTGILIEKWHPGNTVVSPILEAYLIQSFTREQLVQVFIDYAENVPPIELPSIYTAEQIQAALQPSQFALSGFYEGSHVISVQRIERQRDYLWHEPAAELIDLSNAARYRVMVASPEPLDDYLNRVALFTNIHLPITFTRDGDYTIFTDYHYFNDENGMPVQAFVMC